ncbi:S8 family peptidase [Pedobacter cryotolerans]|uniref:Peptidase S8 n=1 Tax=Pedobacter cryotolerans TaxID=2571270 RepID=A0A4U1C8A5_9SPHI|nr:S8 family peptidase [Pedobacter cryotolerans]TKC01781.1 peptidase S8 [Pedobacter cryotolerans]
MNKNIFKNLLVVALVTALPFLSNAQRKANWQNFDLKTDSIFGISTEKAYTELLKGKKSTPVLVAVIDGGVDLNHEDLKRVIWKNTKEIPGNGVDDDKNGYIDDVHGWNFLGGKDGKSIEFETLELTRLVRRDQARFAKVTAATIAEKDKADYEIFVQNREELEKRLVTAKSDLAGITGFKFYLDQIVKKIGKPNPTIADIEAFKPTSQQEEGVKGALLNVMKEMDFSTFYTSQIEAGYKQAYEMVNYNLNVDYNPRDIVGDDPNNSKERFYGNNDIKGPDALHGSHVAGIIAADRTNAIGIKGVAANVMIMGVRNTPSGDERDKDVANAIRYAADNGAKVLNMSFGKGYSWDKAIVDEAVKYAVSKDVLLVHAAGNDNKDTDVEPNFPSKKYLDGGVASSYIVVGASDYKDDENLKAAFSNYGKTSVDVFAPGVRINSTIPDDNKYSVQDGTSMAAPVVAGLAALIRSYYPKLSAVQVKEIIMKSVVKVNRSIKNMKGADTVDVPFADLCVSGGIVNAYNALKLAATYK